MTLAITIFEIPHLQTQICLHLSNKDIYCCTLVSKEWSHNFGPYLWQDINIFYKHQFKKLCATLAHRRIGHTRHYIRSLTIYYAKLAALLLGQKEKYESRAHHKMHFSRHRRAYSDLASALQHLSLDRSSTIAPVSFVNLTVLKSCHHRCKTSSGHDNAIYLDAVLEIARSSPRLEQLEIGYFDYNDDVMTTELGELIYTHPTLQDFALKAHGYVNSDLVRLLLRSGSGLRQLELHCVPTRYPVEYSDEEKRLMLEMPSPVLQHLVLNSSYSYWGTDQSLFSFLEQCTEIEALQPPKMYSAHWSRFCSVIKSHMPRLKHVSLSHPDLTDGDCATLLRALADRQSRSIPVRSTETRRLYSRKKNQAEIAEEKQELVHPRLESFNMKNGEMLKSLTVQSLILCHHSTLTQVSVAGCRHISGADLHRMLLSLSNLIRFQATGDSSAFSYGRVDPVLRVKDLLSPAPQEENEEWHLIEEVILPWACVDLKELHIRFQETEREPFPRQVYEQISKLRNLEKLYVQRQAVVVLTVSEVTPATTTSSRNSAEDHDQREGPMRENDEGASTTQDPADSKNTTTEDEKRMEERENNVEMALNSLKDLQQLRVLDLTELHMFVYSRQLHDMKKALPHLGWIQLYGDN
ncbi:hypothetical protein BGZ59_007334 [Podila verticillata]|nr:hypothetical protein BGZ59_007334 [Podila verticillata]KAI9236567.1 MAG: hypothetical protein BYD32DRAFT_437350 [Podila humilis]KFH67346.1 hypothetical protein MVEG_06080 [Podila verticillata NRRL 6337]